MDRTFILFNIYTSENNANMKDNKSFLMYPHVAGTLEGVEKELADYISRATKEGLSVEELSSSEVHAGQYFDKVVKIQSKTGGPRIFGISSVWSV